MRDTLKALWERVRQMMHSPYAPLFLFAYSFIETLITLIPIDPFALAAMAADKSRAYVTALYIVGGSLAGALVGYAIGSYALEEWGGLLLGTTSAQHALAHITALWQSHEFLITFTTAFVPIPKTPTILAAGFLSESVWVFIIAWVLGRSLHFVVEAVLVRAAVAEEFSYTTRILSVVSILFFVCVVGYIALSESGLSLIR